MEGAPSGGVGAAHYIEGESTKLSYVAGEGAATTLPPLGETLFLKQIVLVNPYQKIELFKLESWVFIENGLLFAAKF